MVDDDDPALITKKFWSHVKSSSNLHRIPESVYFKNKIRTDAGHKLIRLTYSTIVLLINFLMLHCMIFPLTFTRILISTSYFVTEKYVNCYQKLTQIKLKVLMVFMVRFLKIVRLGWHIHYHFYLRSHIILGIYPRSGGMQMLFPSLRRVVKRM